MPEANSLGLHDAEVIAVAIDRLSGIARLDLRQEDGVPRSVELHGVKAFRSVDLTLQNVISRVLRSSTGQLSGEALAPILFRYEARESADAAGGAGRRDGER